MNIGIDASFFRKPMTGIGQVTAHLLRNLVEFQHTNLSFGRGDFKFQNENTTLAFQDLNFILYCQAPPQLDFELPHNFQVKVFLPWWKRDDVIRQWLWERQLAQEAMRDACDVFLSTYQSATVFKDQSSKNIPKHVMFVHDLVPKLFPEYLTKWSQRWHYRALERGIQQANALLVPSQATKDDIVRCLGYDSEKIHITPLGVDQRFSSRLTETDLRERLKKYDLVPGYLYHGGGLEIRKNTEFVLRAYQALRHELGDLLPPLVISGKVHADSNPLATPVIRLIAELGLQNAVKLVGLVPDEDLPALYQGAKIFVFPSRYEGFGLPVLEAMAAGVPVVTSDAGSLKELVTNESAVVLSHAELSQKTLKEAWHSLLRDEELQETLRERGFQTASMYSWKKFAEQVIIYLVQ